MVERVIVALKCKKNSFVELNILLHFTLIYLQLPGLLSKICFGERDFLHLHLSVVCLKKITNAGCN